MEEEGRGLGTQEGGDGQQTAHLDPYNHHPRKPSRRALFAFGYILHYNPLRKEARLYLGR